MCSGQMVDFLQITIANSAAVDICFFRKILGACRLVVGSPPFADPKWFSLCCTKSWTHCLVVSNVFLLS